MTRTENPDRPLRVAFPKPDARHKLGGPFAEAVERMGLAVVPSEENGMIFNATDSRGRIEYFQIIYARPADALKLMECGAIDMAVVGNDVLEEHQYERSEKGEDSRIVPNADLNFASCRLVAAVPEKNADDIRIPRDLLSLRRDKTGPLRIATSFENTVKVWLDDNDIGREEVEFFPLDGGVELAIGLGIADVVCDLKQSGMSLEKARLRDVFNIASPSTACLVTASHALSDQESCLADRIISACGEMFGWKQAIRAPALETA